MAGANLLSLIDDIATILDDVAILTKVAAKKTAGVLGDDLALNAQQVSGVVTDRELPVVWAVAKGSALNKAILVPAALGINFIAPWAVTPLLMLGGAFLCYEGFEKVVHKFFHKVDQPEEGETLQHLINSTPEEVAEFEKNKVKGAIRTDFILSAEIIVISLGTVQAAPFMTQLGVLTTISVLMTVGVYGLVAGIVKLDDLGLHLTQKPSAALAAFGRGIVRFSPILMKLLGIAGTVAMFLVGGDIMAHGIPGAMELSATVAAASGPLAFITPTLFSGLIGVLTGAVVLGLVTLVKKLKPAAKAPSA